jgi:hypothetical protein
MKIAAALEMIIRDFTGVPPRLQTMVSDLEHVVHIVWNRQDVVGPDGYIVVTAMNSPQTPARLRAAVPLPSD